MTLQEKETYIRKAIDSLNRLKNLGLRLDSIEETASPIHIKIVLSSEKLMYPVALMLSDALFNISTPWEYDDTCGVSKLKASGGIWVDCIMLRAAYFIYRTCSKKQRPFTDFI